MTRPSKNTASGPDYEGLIAGIKRLLTDRLQELMTDMGDNTNDRLFELTGSTTDNAQRNRYYELMRKFRDYKPLLFDDFFSHIELLLRPYAESENEKNKHKKDAEVELSLVDQDIMEDIVMVKSLGERTAGAFYQTLSDLETRLAYLAGKTGDIFAKDAIAPVNIYQAFNDALGKDFNILDKKPLFQIFNDLVTSQLGDTYENINKLLINADILPDIKPQAPKHASSSGSSASSHTSAPQHNLDSDIEQPVNSGGYAMTAAPGHGYTNPAGSAGSNSTGQGGSSGQNYGYPSESGGEGPNNAAPGSASHGHTTQGNTPATHGNTQQQHGSNSPAQQMIEAIGNYIGAPIGAGPSGAEPSGEAGENAWFPGSSAQTYGHQEILTALSGIQNSPEFSQAGELQNNAEAIKQAVLSQIASASGGVVTKRINQIAEKTINFIELIFDAIIEDENISDTIKTLLLRLQIPVIKAAMVDHEFFLSDTHPARVLLDKIAEVGIGVTDHTDSIYIEIEALITRLVNEFELNTETFQKTLDELNAIEDERNKEACKKEEEAQKQVLREHARSTVLKALRKITAGKTLPESVHPLVLKRWPTLMYNHYLSHGKENDEWVVINELLRDIVNSVQPIDSAEKMIQLVAIRHKLTESAYVYFNRTSQSKQDIHNVIKGLEDAHSMLIDNSEFSIDQVDTSDETIITDYNTPEPEEHKPEELKPEEPQEEIQKEEIEEKQKLPPNIMPGMWFKVYMGEDKPARRCKLSVIIAADAKLVFVNYQGEMLVEKGFDEFTAEIKEDKSKVIMGHSTFDHALSRAVTQLSPQL